ncbi:hypothetical protein THAR02_02911 [Trichoderma harzianum]|uniref:Nephrocystin 3-like N-terminal domain-containing protein n=1 Tax=Trichoderma harzianum TaxID=5544 RepID=A0A0G0AJC3_TRIHA|nr:hypothetical protein THAR02_02911 [Trichoderma harzianum]
MDPLSALAIAAAVFQFLELGGKLCIKGWEKYKHIQQGVPHDQKHTEEEEQLRKIFEELSGQISWFQEVSTSIVVSQPPTPTQTMKSAKRKNRGGADIQRINDDIELIEEKLEQLKRETMDFILLSLWLIELFGKAEKIPLSKPHISVLSNPQTTAELDTPEDYTQQSGAAISIMLDEETVGLRNALQPLIQPRIGPVSLKQLADDMIQYLQKDNRAMNTIREELVEILWEKGWKLDPSMASAKIDTTVVAHAIATGIQFSNFQTREGAISNTFMETYSWILQNEPPKKDNTPLWDSFPHWLEDDSNKVYWITGKPGSGKSTMVKLISQHVALRDMLSRSLGSLRLLLVKFYAWLAGTTLQKSLEGLKRTIISQALEQYPDLAPVLVQDVGRSVKY